MISVVSPVYNEQDSLAQFYVSLKSELENLGIDYEILLVDDGSIDNSRAIIKQLADEDGRVRPLILAKNFGKEAALTAGLDYATGDAVLMIDSDGQHPVELIAELVRLWKSGAQTVVGVRKSNRDSSPIKSVFSKLYSKLQRRVFESAMPEGLTDFCLIDREVAEAVRSLGERDRMMRGLVNLVGFERELVEFDAKDRIGGEPSYSFRKLYQLTINSITSLSSWPLLLIMNFGLLVSASSILLDAFLIVEKYILRDPFEWDISGAAIISVSVVVLVGIIISCLGVLGLYISKINTEVQGRPLYIVNKRSSIK